ncbi:hypothetical protein [Desulfolithobacter sp.]
MFVLARLKPGVNRSVHLFVASLLWTSIGIMLIVRGWGWMGPGSGRWLVLPALALGMAKSFLVLDRATRRSVARIIELRDGTCLGAVYSWKTWALVGLMMASGITMRALTEPGRVVGTVYVAIGCGLLFSSRHGWLAWFKWMHHD